MLVIINNSSSTTLISFPTFFSVFDVAPLPDPNVYQKVVVAIGDYYYFCTVIVIIIKHLWIRLSALFPVKSAERLNQFSFRLESLNKGSEPLRGLYIRSITTDSPSGTGIQKTDISLVRYLGDVGSAMEFIIIIIIIIIKGLRRGERNCSYLPQEYTV